MGLREGKLLRVKEEKLYILKHLKFDKGKDYGIVYSGRGKPPP